MKAILVIDMPDEYRAEDVLVDYCLHTKGEYKTIRKSGNHPLKPMPKEEDIYEVGMDEEDTNAKRQWNKGWNACLEEIEK